MPGERHPDLSLFLYLKAESGESRMNEADIDRRALELGEETNQFWQAIKTDAMKNSGKSEQLRAGRNSRSPDLRSRLGGDGVPCQVHK